MLFIRTNAMLLRVQLEERENVPPSLAFSFIFFVVFFEALPNVLRVGAFPPQFIYSGHLQIIGTSDL